MHIITPPPFTFNKEDRVHQQTVLYNLMNDYIRFVQPIRNLKTGDIDHCELLLRAKNSKVNTAPFELIQSLEQEHLSFLLDMGSLYIASKYLGKYNPSFPLAVNVSPSSLQHTPFINFAENVLNRLQEPTKIQFELTETTVLEATPLVSRFVNMCCDKGIVLSADDFGSGHMSMDVIRQFPFREVKLDGSIIKSLEQPKSLELVKSLCEYTTPKDIKVVAEFIDTRDKLHRVKELGIGFGQGYLLGRPNMLMEYIREERSSCLAP